jgi:D-aminopeptidase
MSINGETTTLGVLVQSNFGGRLTIKGVNIAQEFDRQDTEEDGSSIMIIVATDFPFSNRLLNRLSKRATFGMARTGSTGGHGSGDYVIAFSTTQRTPGAKPVSRKAIAEDEGCINAAFEAVAEATEEAIINSLFKAETVTDPNGETWEAVPIDRVVELLRSKGLIEPIS